MRLLAALLLLALAPAAVAQTLTATTEDGRSVRLFEDGSWMFDTSDAGESSEMPEEPMGTPGLLEGAAVDYALRYDPEAWTLTDMFDNPSAEHMLAHTSMEAFLLVVPERTYIPQDNLVNVALENSLQTAPDMKVLTRKKVEVGGRQVTRMEMAGTSSGIPFTFLGYYYSDPDFGSIQVTGFTGTSLYEEYEPVLESVMRSLVFTADADTD